MSETTRRHEGTRWTIAYGSYEGVERFAVNELQRTVQHYLPYVVEARPARGLDGLAASHVIAVGTPADNAVIAEGVKRNLIPAPEGRGGYGIAACNSPKAGTTRLVSIAGGDRDGVLHGVEDFCAAVSGVVRYTDSARDLRAAFDGMPDFRISERPAVAERGIWTWGYVIYDYRSFMDNMARLRMNVLTIWNDCPPLNSRDIIEYAHDRGIRVIFGFHWGWGLDGVDLSRAADRRRLKARVLENYRENYRSLDLDGIYFQTLTEHSDTEIRGKSVASVVCDFVNDVAGEILEENPEQIIQFGLHATSIREHYGDLAALDPRVIIVWEDAGGIPYSYDPAPGASTCEGVSSAEETVEYSRKLARLRAGRFAMVAKGWTNLDWRREFEHHGPFILGERGQEFVRRRALERHARWDYVNALWLRHYAEAARFYTSILEAATGGMTVVGLVEDGGFEAAIEPSVSIFAQTLWNPRRDPSDILAAAMSPYYQM